MAVNKLKSKWTRVDKDALSKMLKNDSSTGIRELDVDSLPKSIQKMPGVTNYFIATYLTPISIGTTDTIVKGEMAVVRKDQEFGKAYNYIFASSGDGQVYFNGPYKQFSDHHFSSTSDVSLEQLFGHALSSTKSSL